MRLPSAEGESTLALYRDKVLARTAARLTPNIKENDHMIPSTPRGFRDCLPTEAAWRQAVDRRVRDSFGDGA